MLPDLTDIQKRRLRLGLKQAELAKYSAVSQSLIAKIESGKIDPGYSKIRSVLETLEVLENRTSHKVEDIMSKSIIHVAPATSVSHTVELLRKHGISQLPVITSTNQIVGSITEDGLLHRFSQEPGRDWKATAVEAVMGQPFPTVKIGIPTSAITPLLHTDSAVIVVDKGKYVGIVTKADLLKTIK
ncbi:transcriptional regulator [Candidatus Micrarchaeota archaeon CG08_land_8_20_14_0_20_49_17]|nr:MAG: hypothetical protein AUJ13_05345 [Candidatus Micrarchaeota archaeon CG1_02_49_24]PIU09561.1 MAG: transcriptional regulator [Candidatus Micrarchaeota archaeon CG08_land_8_20_14_0_20_49_17]PIU81228.1 MAG: transcriptional regulator [Candidatus Micrarchaeota archaeon CG06_land_8_20_14_3_00_50_6]HII54423.1 CBS domain-containing protein [Candidatus Micrarchaeota archaeon]